MVSTCHQSLIREFHLFAIADHASQPYMEVDSIHNDEGYQRVRQLLSEQYHRDNQLPDLQITGYAKDDDRSLKIQHRLHRQRPLSNDANKVMRYLQELWGIRCSSGNPLRRWRNC